MAGESNGRVTISPLAGKPAPKEMLVDVARLETEYLDRRPDVRDATQMVSFGTSGHPGHLWAPLRARGLGGPVYGARTAHPLPPPAQRTALEVLAANNVETIIQRD